MHPRQPLVKWKFKADNLEQSAGPSKQVTETDSVSLIVIITCTSYSIKQEYAARAAQIPSPSYAFLEMKGGNKQGWCCVSFH